MGVLDIVFPKNCVVCGKFGRFLCGECIQTLEQKELICPICFVVSNGGETHFYCKDSCSLDGLWSLASFKGPMRGIIHKFKYKLVKEASNELVELLFEYCNRYNPLFLDKILKDKWVVTSVPLHSWRSNWRGFNQSEVLGRKIAGRLALQYENLVERVLFTLPQVALHKDKRRTNLRGAVKVISEVEGKNVVLVDDVWTTGSTMKECARVLKKAGAKRVWALTLAR